MAAAVLQVRLLLQLHNNIMKAYNVNFRYLLVLLLILGGVFLGLLSFTNVHVLAAKASFSVSVDEKSSPSSIEKDVEPKQVINVRLIFSNHSNQTQEFKVSPNTAFTGDNGIVQYNLKQLGNRYFGKLKFNSMVSGTRMVTLAPHQTIQKEYTIRIPTETFKGVFVGGFYVSQRGGASKADVSSDGKKAIMGYQSKVSYVIPVILQENEQIIHTKLNLEKVVAKSVVGEPVILAKIANLTPTYFGQLQLKAKVYTKDQHKKILKQTNSNMEMAPLSYFNYHIRLKKPLAKGKYMLVLKMNSGKRKWEFKRDFLVTTRVSQISQKTANNNDSNKINYPLIVLAGILLLMLLVVIYYLGKQRGKNVGK
ncbi:DUF3324 domain-containing protein [Liquorilactobacillus ghanensis]|nr:DUF3324 domain-containing protein [Liquorilactobacillus ghanensis]